MSLPLADLSLDLDNKWSYLKTRGDESWITHPSYLDLVVPFFLSILKKHQLKITVFVVGQDAVIDTNIPA
jgi:peptidoglycan/xylan/chitin deacetylase (PgdA/CDA1 family)